MTQLRQRVAGNSVCRMGRLRSKRWNWAVSVLCALALSLVAFAHRPATADTRLSDPEITAYLALGGSLTELCLSGEAGEDGAGHTECPACTLAKSMALAPTPIGPCRVALPAPERAIWPETPRLAGYALHAPSARGPPIRPTI